MNEFAEMIMECVRAGHDQQIPPQAVALVLIGLEQRYSPKVKALSVPLLASPGSPHSPAREHP